MGTSSFQTIHADPPWNFKTYSKKGESRSASTHYDVMSIKDIAKLPVEKVAAPDCALFMWVTDPMLPRAFELFEAWGFVFKTVAFTWAKTNKGGGFFTGMGFWTRANPEMCLLATRGKPKRLAKDVRRLIVAPRREHSRKPDEVYSSIERLTEGPYLDMFSRQNRTGWISWGNESGKFDGESKQDPVDEFL